MLGLELSINDMITKIKSVVRLTVALFVIFINLFEVLDYKYNPMEYERVYHIGNEGVDWKFRSEQNFIIWNIGSISLAAIYLVVSLFYFINREEAKYSKVVLIVFELVGLLWVLWTLYLWYSTGFDY